MYCKLMTAEVLKNEKIFTYYAIYCYLKVLPFSPTTIGYAQITTEALEMQSTASTSKTTL